MILVTGAYGFVGRALVQALQKYTDEQILTPSSAELNLLDYYSVEEYFKGKSIQFVFHLAARLGGVGLVSNKPLQFLEDNLLINYNIVRVAARKKVHKFITLGSSCCYSEDVPLPNRETDLWRGYPENTYGICKLVLLEHLARQSDMNWVYLLPPNIYGEGDHFGEADSHFIPATVMKFQKAIAEGKHSIEVWGDGSQTRDFVYIDDIVHFLIEAFIGSSFDRNPVNISTGKETSIRQVTETIRRLMGLDGKIEIAWAPDKPTGTLRKVLDNTKVSEIAPHYSFVGIDEGLRRTLSFLEADTQGETSECRV